MSNKKNEDTITDLKTRRIMYKILTIALIIILCFSLKFFAAIIVGIIGIIVIKIVDFKIETRYDEILEDNHKNLENIEKNTEKD